MDQIKIGQFLKLLRNEKGLTQEQLAEKIGVSHRTVSRWETGNNLPDISTLIQLSELYEVDIREIIDGERKSENMNEEMKNTIKQVARYTEHQKEQIIIKMKKNSITVVSLYAVIYLLCTFLLILISEKTIGSTAVILPALLILSGYTLLLQRKSILKNAACFLPAVSGFFFSAEYILLELRIYDNALRDTYPFSNVINGQMVNIGLGVLFSLIVLFLNYLLNKRHDSP
ncbi:MAG: helix-turn-helix domain-containing protein [Oscillospiraceae bacterium]